LDPFPEIPKKPFVAFQKIGKLSRKALKNFLIIGSTKKLLNNKDKKLNRPKKQNKKRAIKTNH
jgi:hypothetical protein